MVFTKPVGVAPLLQTFGDARFEMSIHPKPP